MICNNSPSDEKTISIVVACRNERKHIHAFTKSLLAQDLLGFDWELIIADGKSEDGTREFLSEFARGNSRITVIENSFRIVATGLNAAIQAARGEIILRMDTHSEYAPDYVKKCVETLEAGDACNVGGPARTKAEGLCSRAIRLLITADFHLVGLDSTMNITAGTWTLCRMAVGAKRHCCVWAFSTSS